MSHEIPVTETNPVVREVLLRNADRAQSIEMLRCLIAPRCAPEDDEPTFLDPISTWLVWCLEHVETMDWSTRRSGHMILTMSEWTEQNEQSDSSSAR